MSEQKINGFLSCFTGSNKEVLAKFLNKYTKLLKENEDLQNISLGSNGELTLQEFGGNNMNGNVIEFMEMDDVNALQEALLSDGEGFDVVTKVVRAASVEGFRFTYLEFNGGFSIGLSSLKSPSLRQLIKVGTINQEMVDFILLAIKKKVNIVISGTTGSGKSTLLNGLANAVSSEKVAGYDPFDDLKLEHTHRLNIPFDGLTDYIALLKLFGPDRIIMDELREGAHYTKILPHYPTIVSIHSSTPKMAMERLLNWQSDRHTSGHELGVEVDLVIQIDRLRNGTRVVSKISEVVGFGKEGYLMNNKWVKENKLPSKYLIKNGDDNSFYVQDIFTCDTTAFEEINTFNKTDWKPIFMK